MLAELARSEQLLRAYGHVYDASQAAVAQTLSRRDPDEARRFVICDACWGNADAVSAIDLAIDGGFASQARRDDARQLRSELVRLYVAITDRGHRHPAGELVVAPFRKWGASSV